MALENGFYERREIGVIEYSLIFICIIGFSLPNVKKVKWVQYFQNYWKRFSFYLNVNLIIFRTIVIMKWNIRLNCLQYSFEKYAAIKTQFWKSDGLQNICSSITKEN